MVTLHPEPLTLDGKKFVVLPYDEFEAMQEEREQIQDLISFSESEAEFGTAPRIPWEKLKEELGLEI